MTEYEKYDLKKYKYRLNKLFESYTKKLSECIANNEGDCLKVDDDLEFFYNVEGKGYLIIIEKDTILTFEKIEELKRYIIEQIKLKLDNHGVCNI